MSENNKWVAVITTFAALAAPGCELFAGDAITLGRRVDAPRSAAGALSGGAGGGGELGESTALGTCIVEWDPLDAQEDLVIEGLTARNPDLDSTNNGVRATAGHARGRYYFEVSVEDAGLDALQQVGVTVHSGEEDHFVEIGCFTDVGACAAIQGYSPGDIISVAADLDSGVVAFGVNGVPDTTESLSFEPRAVATVAGAGPYLADVMLSAGGVVHANFGASPFAFAPPEGYAPWASGLAADANGFCISDLPAPIVPAPVSAACALDEGYALSTFDTGVTGDVELNVFGVYEPVGDEVVVQIDQPGRHVLVLGTYESLHWRVLAGDGVTIERVIAYSYDEATVEAPAGVPVDARSYASGDAYVAVGTTWPFEMGGGDTLGFVGTAEEESGLPLSTFAGTYRTSRFTLHDGPSEAACE